MLGFSLLSNFTYNAKVLATLVDIPTFNTDVIKFSIRFSTFQTKVNLQNSLKHCGRQISY